MRGFFLSFFGGCELGMMVIWAGVVISVVVGGLVGVNFV